MVDIMKIIVDRDPQEREFHQAVSEVMESVKPVLDQNPIYRQAKREIYRLTVVSGLK
jgi:glutamate dehydrogenase (NADP+)